MLQNCNFTKKIVRENMLRKLVPITLLLLIIVSCAKTDAPDAIDYSSIDKKIIEDYLTAHNDTTAQSTASGLYYIIQRSGASSHPNINSIVSVNYKGYLTNGTVFDSSASGIPLKYVLGGLIAGWQEGLQLIGTGGKMTLFCPSALGYGSEPQTRKVGGVKQTIIPANSVLIFDLELVKF
jgi:FKBP-type peptidyl-prolyl cis-trans isomerase